MVCLDAVGARPKRPATRNSVVLTIMACAVGGGGWVSTRRAGDLTRWSPAEAPRGPGRHGRPPGGQPPGVLSGADLVDGAAQKGAVGARHDGHAAAADGHGLRGIRGATSVPCAGGSRALAAPPDVGARGCCTRRGMRVLHPARVPCPTSVSGVAASPGPPAPHLGLYRGAGSGAEAGEAAHGLHVGDKRLGGCRAGANLQSWP